MMKILRINMNNLAIAEEEAKGEYKNLGGRALTSRIIKDEVEPTCHPLGEHNKIIIAPGLLTGTTAPCSGRLSIGGKSPLTGTIKESNAGGTASQKIAKLGYKAIIIEGKARQDGLYIIKINTSGAEIIRADELKGMGTYQTAQTLRDKYGDSYSVICIGPAGEEKLSAASIAVTNIEGETSRHAARGGLGAVLGSKRIKAIIIDNEKQDKISYADEKGFKSQAAAFAKSLVETKQVLTKYGTANLVGPINALKGLPTRNFSVGEFEGASKISGEVLRERITERNGKTGHPCHPGCVIRCSNIYNDEKGNYITSGFEYETIILTGSNCGIDDLDVIAKIDRFCDDFGLDTMDTGAAIGVLMESGLLEFGDTEGVFNLLKEIKQLTPLGRIIGSGAEITGKVFGVTRVPTVKGQAISAYDPRAFKGTGVTYATSPMGA
ncbi:MAG: aldehyde:ferredoxin oxidoreductase, partial [Thermosediminibacterales bacterium]|nr:aldehyde:ferredoxin oxidoreductase [Thermosediminibacterales bacterium]